MACLASSSRVNNKTRAAAPCSEVKASLPSISIERAMNSTISSKVLMGSAMITMIMSISPSLAFAQQATGPIGYFWGQQAGNYVSSAPVQTTAAGTPSCSIMATPNAIPNGRFAQLRWTSVNAVAARISDGIGMVAPSGVLPVDPEASRLYVLTVYSPNGTAATCSTTLTVAGRAPVLSLSNIPYTGLADTASYWIAIVAFASALAYLLAYARGFLKRA